MKISTSIDGVSWTTALIQTFPDPRPDFGGSCDPPLQTLDFIGYARYIKTEVLDHYGKAVVYDYFNIVVN